MCTRNKEKHNEDTPARERKMSEGGSRERRGTASLLRRRREKKERTKGISSTTTHYRCLVSEDICCTFPLKKHIQPCFQNNGGDFFPQCLAFFEVKTQNIQTFLHTSETMSVRWAATVHTSADERSSTTRKRYSSSFGESKVGKL